MGGGVDQRVESGQVFQDLSVYSASLAVRFRTVHDTQPPWDEVAAANICEHCQVVAW